MGTGSGAPGGASGAPAGGARHLRFTATKGSWMSVDMSPDGARLVVDLLGDIYTVPATGGSATRLTSGMAHDAQPRWSPDGKRIAFISDRSGGNNLWVMAADGSDTLQLSKTTDDMFVSPEWTPDGKYIAVTRSVQGAPKIFLYHVDGGAGIQVIREPAPLSAIGATFSPDGRYLWYGTRQATWTYNAIFPQFQLASYDRELGTTTTMTARYGSGFRPAVSPDGKWLAYGSRYEEKTGLRVRELATGDERWLAYPIQRDNQEAMLETDALPGYDFTPDSKAIVISYGGEIWRVPVDGSAPAKIPFSIDVDVAIGPEVKFQYPIEDTPTIVARQIRDAVPSPDGTRIAFSALGDLYVMELPGGAAPHRVERRGGVPSLVVARRCVGRVRDVGERRRTPPQGARRRARAAGAPHARDRHVLRHAVVPRRDAHRRHAGRRARAQGNRAALWRRAGGALRLGAGGGGRRDAHPCSWRVGRSALHQRPWAHLRLRRERRARLVPVGRDRPAAARAGDGSRAVRSQHPA
ncbi:MAG: PD40 domain-containing protein [Gemmatimonadetes bacterium]|nr:PD40 domain-containing protein [Gemmatimonadota bacterium]